MSYQGIHWLKEELESTSKEELVRIALVLQDEKETQENRANRLQKTINAVSKQLGCEIRVQEKGD